MAESTYAISPDGTAITCRRCGLTSHSKWDVANLYCGHCHDWHGSMAGVAMHTPAECGIDEVLDLRNSETGEPFATLPADEQIHILKHLVLHAYTEAEATGAARYAERLAMYTRNYHRIMILSLCAGALGVVALAFNLWADSR